RSALPGKAVDAYAPSQQINISSQHRLWIPGRHLRYTFTHRRGQQGNEALITQKLEPGDAIAIIATVMVALDSNHGNIVIFELLQSFDGMNERLRIDGAVIKQV